MITSKDLITSIEQLPAKLAASVSPAEKKFIEEIKRREQLPFAVTPHFASLAGPEAEDPIRRQFFPDPREAQSDPFALDDPLGEKLHSASKAGAPRLVHQYKDRALLLAGGACAGYCRYCFRRVWLGTAPPFIKINDEAGNPGELKAVLAYLAAHPELKEILVSGGDPLTADNDRLEKLFSTLRQARPGIALRVCTRVPVTNPQRLCEKTIALLRQFRPLRLAIHLNHPRELALACRTRLDACVKAGIPALTQTVLLRGVNDNAMVLAELFKDCVDLGLSPYYLFQMDLAPGSAHFRVPLGEGLVIYRELEKLIPGTSLPAYAVDLPGGGGKIRLGENAISGEKATKTGQVYLLRDGNGKLWEYPKK